MPIPLHLNTHPDPVDGCFGCKAAGTMFTWCGRDGYGEGRKTWHGPSERERANRAVAEARAAGIDPQPVGRAWV